MTVLEDETHVSDNLPWFLVRVLVDLVLDGREIHGRLDKVEVVRSLQLESVTLGLNSHSITNTKSLVILGKEY